MAIENLILSGRIVAGNTTNWEAVKDDNNQPKIGKSGEPLFSNWIYLAVPKQDFLTNVWPQIVQEAVKVYPNAVNVHPDNYEQDGFAWKIINGDSPYPPKKKPNAAPYNQREGFAGNYIIKISTFAFLPDTVVFQNGAYRKLEAGQVKTGDFINANVKLETRSDRNGMGFYWNPNGYELTAIGEAISGGGEGGNPNNLFGDASQRTGGFQGVLPTAGGVAPAMPVAPAHDLVQNVMGVPQAPQLSAAPAMPQQPQLPQAAVGTVAPATSFPTNIPGLPQAR